MDLLSEILENARWKTDLLVRTAVKGPWGLRFPCARSAGFHIVLIGSFYVRTPKRLLKLEQGDILYMARGLDHDLVSDPERRAGDLKEFRRRYEKEKPPERPSTAFLTVRYEIPDGPLHPLFLELPEMISVRTSLLPPHHPLHTALVLLSQEADRGPATDLIVQRLSDILLYYVLRHWMEQQKREAPGWIRAFHDEKIRSTLEAMHRQPSRGWTIGELAHSVGVSRASLASRFRDSLGVPPMEYLMRLRVEKGRSLIAEQNVTLEEAARNVGYSSAFAFSRAYKRVRGVAPGQDRG